MGTNRALLVTENGKTTRYETIKEAAVAIGISPNALGSRIRRNANDGRIYQFIPKSSTMEAGGVTYERGRQRVPYETLGSRVCITPCKHKEWVKIGSVLCQACGSFGGINRSEHVVLCSFKTI